MATGGIKPQPKPINGHIAFDQLSLSSGASLVLRETASAEEWKKVNYRWAETAETNPLAVAYPATIEDVQAIVRFAVKAGVRLAVKGGGHAQWSCNGIDDGLVIDMVRIKSVKVADDKKTVIIGGGALWEHVFPITDAAEVAVVGGGVGNVGVGGFLTGAGYSWMSGLYGLGCDNVVAMQVVLASGDVVHCDSKTEPELFWSIRGGSSNFGVVTEFTINAFPHPGPALTGVLIYDESQLHDVWECAKHYLSTRSKSQSLVFMFGRNPYNGAPNIIIPPYVPGPDKETIAKDPAFGGFFTKAKPVMDMTFIAPGFDGISHGADSILLGGPRRKRAGHVLFEPEVFFDKQMLDGAWALWKQLTADLPGGQVMFEMHHADKTASFPTDFTAYHAAGRRKHYYVLLVCQYDGAENDDRAGNYIASLTEFLRNEQIRITGNSLDASGNGCEEHEPVETIYGEHYARLIKNKDRYDPERVFNRWHPIPSAVTPI